MSAANQEAQEEELLALSSIYSEDEFKRADTAPGGEIKVCLELPPNFTVSVKSNAATNSTLESFEDTVLFLPPIVLNFELPPGYPSTMCPIFTLSCKWLSPAQLTCLCRRLDDLWEENRGYVVLFAWMQFLKEETLEYLNIESPYEIQLHNDGTQTLMATDEKDSHCNATASATPEEGAVDGDHNDGTQTLMATDEKDSHCNATASATPEEGAVNGDHNDGTQTLMEADEKDSHCNATASATPEEEAVNGDHNDGTQTLMEADEKDSHCNATASATPEEGAVDGDHNDGTQTLMETDEKDSHCNAMASATPEEEAVNGDHNDGTQTLMEADEKDSHCNAMASATPEEEAVNGDHNDGTQTLMETDERDSHCNATASATPEKGAVDGRAIQDVQSVSALIRHILDFNESQQKKCFDSKPYLCNICFSDKLGSDCTYFKDCSHVYCNGCLGDYFEIQIMEGKVRALNCPESKCASVATPAQVKDLVGEQLFSRYDRLLLQSTLELMTDVVYCPRPGCETAVMQEPEGTMGICTNCQYAFCTLCMLTYHGLSPCKGTEVEPEEPTEPKDPPRKKRRDPGAKNPSTSQEEEEPKPIEKGPRGKRAQERESKKWIKENAKACPNCKVKIHKNDGCNKMACTRCGQYFCWLCVRKLPDGDPYLHYKDPSSKCLGKTYNP